MDNKIRLRLEKFIRKYHKNNILKGLIILGTLFIFLMISFSLLEYVGWFSKHIRAILFFSFLAVNLYITIKYVAIPVFRLIGLAKGLSRIEAARIIGKHFLSVDDKLVNFLQLSALKQRDTLLEAAIQQKEAELSPFKFTKAINRKATLRQLKYFVPIIIALFLILLINPTLISEPAQRISKFDVKFEKDPPYSFLILNKKLEVVEQDNITINITTKGDEIPGEVNVITDDIQHKAKKIAKNRWEYTFKNLRKNRSFTVAAGEVSSRMFVVKVVLKPVIKSFEIAVNYPAYTEKQNETMVNVGDLVVPRGTMLTWKIKGKNCSALEFRLDDNFLPVKKDDHGVFMVAHRSMISADYAIKTINHNIDTTKPVVFSLQVIDDRYPMIQVNEIRDSLNDFMLFFSGQIADDYGFEVLQFYSATVQNNDTSDWRNEKIDIQKNVNKQRFFYYVDLKKQAISPNEELIYYFKITDNDRVTGPKSTKSLLQSFKIMSEKEIIEETKNAKEQITNDIEKSIQNLVKVNKSIDKLSDELKTKKSLTWEDKQKIEQLLQDHKSLKRDIESIIEKNEYIDHKENQYLKMDEEMLEKQKQLKEMMKDLMDEETLKLLEELQKLMDELSEDKVNEMLEKMKMSTDEMKMELDRTLEMFKQLELEKNLKEVIDELEKLAQKQDDLADESENKSNDADALSDDQEKLNDEFEDIREKIENIEKKNKELEYPQKLDNTQDEQKAIENEMKDSKNQLQKNNRNNATKHQRNAAQKMNQLSQQMSMNLQQMQQEQTAEDIEVLRQVLNNLVQLSFEQEKLLETTNTTNRKNPKFPELIGQQKKLKDDFSVIEDSLMALSKRQPAIKNIIHKEIAAINENMDISIDHLLSMNTVGIVPSKAKNNATSRQQYAMTSMNNLALLIAESLNQLMQQLQNQKAGNDKPCNNPGGSGGGMSMQKIRSMQESLNQQLQKMKDQMGKGQQNNGENNRNSMSEQFAKMAAKQEAIRRALQQYLDELQKQGMHEKGKLGDVLKEMEKTEEELVNKIINNQTLNRQKEIKTRLLESEKAEQEQEQEEKRESKEAKNYIFSNPKLFLEYNKLKDKEVEMLQFSSPSLTPFYKNVISDFLLKLEVE